MLEAGFEVGVNLNLEAEFEIGVNLNLEAEFEIVVEFKFLEAGLKSEWSLNFRSGV